MYKFLFILILVLYEFCNSEELDKADQNIDCQILDELGAFSSLISRMSAITDQYKVLFEHILPLAREFYKENREYIQQSSIHEWDVAINQLFECSKEGVRYMFDELGSHSSDSNITAAELSELYSNSAQFNARCALKYQSVTQVFRPNFISHLYNTTPALSELFLPKSSDVTFSVKRFIPVLENILSEPPVFHEYTNIACKLLQIEREKLKPKVLSMLYELPDAINDLHAMELSISNNYYEGCMKGFHKLTGLFGGYTDKSIDPSSCPCSRLGHFQ